MIAGAPWPIRVLVLAAAVVLYYRIGKGLLFAGCRRLARSVASGRHSENEVGGIIELAAAATTHLALVAALLAVTGVPATAVRLTAPAGLIVLGAVVGVGEMALSAFLCRLLVASELALRARRPLVQVPAASAAGPATLPAWLVMARGGWMRHHLTTLRAVPLALAVPLMAVQVGSEEIVFRGVLVSSLRPAGPAVALGASCALFVAMQTFLTPSWRTAMFPVVGAGVMGVVHGLLFWSVPLLLPLVVAHVVFFLFAVL
jgi:hypothetical protein